MKEMSWNSDRTKREFKLETRLIKALQNPGISRRSFGEIEPTNLPKPNIDFGIFEPDEMFVTMIETLRQRRTLGLKSDADKAQANALRWADYIVDALPGDDDAVEFITMAMTLSREQNPKLSKHIVEIMEAAKKRGVLRKKRQEDLFRRWYANQKRLERLD